MLNDVVLDVIEYVQVCCSIDMSVQTHAHVRLLRQPAYFIFLLYTCVRAHLYRYTFFDRSFTC